MDRTRRFTRVYKYWVIHYRLASATALEWSVGSVMNLSEGGVCFRTEEPLRVGTPLIIQFHFLWEVATPIQGTVLWQKEVGNRVKECGVAFETVGQSTRELINQFVCAWEKRHGAPRKDQSA